MTVSHAPTAVQRVALAASSARRLADLAPPLIARLVALRHRPICLVPGNDPDGATALAALGAAVDTIELPSSGLNLFQGFGAKGRLAAAIKTHRPHAMIAFDLASAAIVMPMAQRAGCQRMAAFLATGGVTCGEDGDVAVSAATAAQLRALIGVGAAVAVAGQDEARFLKALPLAAGATVFAAPQRGIDLADFRAAPLPPLGREGDLEGDAPFVFTTDGSALEGEDIATLAAAMKIVARQIPGVRLLVSASQSDASARGQMRAAAADAPSIAVVDDGQSLGAAITAGHAYVHPQRQAGLTSALLMALALGRPIVASDVAGARETVDQIVNGVLAAPGDAGALAEAMMVIARRADILPALAAASRRKAERRFDATAVNAALLGAIGVPVALGSVA